MLRAADLLAAVGAVGKIIVNDVQCNVYDLLVSATHIQDASWLSREISPQHTAQ